MKFSELKLSPSLLQAVKEKGFEEPTPIQEQAIPIVLAGKDFIGQAKTGTGKTAAFGLPILEKLVPEIMAPQALIMTPTRELALQVAKELTELGRTTNPRITVVYGGASINPQISELRRGAQIIVGTPGRLLDHLERRTINLTKIAFLVLDEADRMLDMGFIPDIKKILSHTPKNRQTMLFSATMPKEIIALSHSYLNNPELIKVSEDDLSIEAIKQFYASVDWKDKLTAISAILEEKKNEHTLVFSRTKIGADNLSHKLRQRGFKVMAMHGNLSQARREKTMDLFRQKKIQVLVATDVAARGLDISHIQCVINYNLPDEHDTYVHRIGRTGRMGQGGEAISIITNLEELNILKNIVRSIGGEIAEKQVDLKLAPKPVHSGSGHRDFDDGDRRERGGRRFGGSSRNYGGQSRDRPHRSFGSGGHSQFRSREGGHRESSGGGHSSFRQKPRRGYSGGGHHRVM